MKRPIPLMKQMKVRECRILRVRSDPTKDGCTKCAQSVVTMPANQKPIPNLVNLFIIQSISHYLLNELTLYKKKKFEKEFCSEHYRIQSLWIQTCKNLIAYGNIVGFGGSLYFFLQSLKRIGTIHTIVIFSMSSVFGLGFAGLFLHEKISAFQIIAIVIMLTGIYLINRKESMKEKEPTSFGF